MLELCVGALGLSVAAGAAAELAATFTAADLGLSADPEEGSTPRAGCRHRHAVIAVIAQTETRHLCDSSRAQQHKPYLWAYALSI